MYMEWRWSLSYGEMIKWTVVTRLVGGRFGVVKMIMTVPAEG